MLPTEDLFVYAHATAGDAIKAGLPLQPA